MNDARNSEYDDNLLIVRVIFICDRFEEKYGMFDLRNISTQCSRYRVKYEKDEQFDRINEMLILRIVNGFSHCCVITIS